MHTAILARHSAILESLKTTGNFQDGQDLFNLPLETEVDMEHLEAELSNEEKRKTLVSMNIVLKDEYLKQ